MFLRCFGDVHMWGQIWPHKVWASLCQVLFFSNLLHSHGVWHFDVWQIISKYNMSCDTQPFTPLPPTTAPSPPSPNPTPNPQRASMCNSYTPRYVLFRQSDVCHDAWKWVAIHSQMSLLTLMLGVNRPVVFPTFQCLQDTFFSYLNFCNGPFLHHGHFHCLKVIQLFCKYPTTQ